MSNMERIKVGKSEATKMLKLLEMFYRKVGSESYLDVKKLKTTKKHPRPFQGLGSSRTLFRVRCVMMVGKMCDDGGVVSRQPLI